MLLRPLSMPGGSLYSSLWAGHKLYAQVDYIYGWKAINEKNGFTAAQATMNIPETLIYVSYLYLVYSRGTLKATSGGVIPQLFAQRSVAGNPAVLVVMLGFTAAVMTFSKTLLYGA